MAGQLQGDDNPEDQEDIVEQPENALGVTQLASQYQALIASITQRVNDLSDQAKASALSTHSVVENCHIMDIDKEIENLRAISKESELLEIDFTKMKHLHIITSEFRARVEKLEKDIKRTRN